MTSRMVYLVTVMYEAARGSVSHPVMAYDTDATARLSDSGMGPYGDGR